MRTIKKVYVSHPIKGQTEEQIAQNEAWGKEWVETALLAEALLPRTIPVIDHPGEHCPRVMDAGQGAEHDWSCYMRADIAAMMGCDGILMMPGWMHSRGAGLELHIALQVGLQPYFYEATPEWRESGRFIWEGLLDG